jgi:hypothetical protein
MECQNKSGNGKFIPFIFRCAPLRASRHASKTPKPERTVNQTVAHILGGYGLGPSLHIHLL